MGKTKKLGRPKGSKKKPLNVYLDKQQIDDLRELSKKDDRTISVMVKKALLNTYGI